MYLPIFGVMFLILIGCAPDSIEKGELALRLGDYEMSKDFFAYKLQKQPDNYAARLGMGKALIQEAAAIASDSSWRRALTHLEAARTIAPHRQEVLELLGETWSVHARNRLDAGDTVTALHALSKSIEYRPTSVEPLNLAGIIYYNLGDDEKAAALFRKAITLDSTNSSAYFNLGMVRWQQKKYGMAHSQWLNALQYDPTDDDIVYWFARAEKSLYGEEN